MLSLGSYLLGAAEIAVVALSLGFGAYRRRRRLMPAWEGPPARLVEAIVAVALLTWISEILGTFTLLYGGTLVAACLLTVCVILWLTSPAGHATGTEGQDDLSPAGGGGAGVPRGAEAPPAPRTVGDAAPTGPAAERLEPSSESPTRAIGLPIGSVSPSWARISVNVPATSLS